jgi:hypothetical protein
MGNECTVLADGGGGGVGGVVKEREGNELTLPWLRLISSHFISPFIMFVSFFVILLRLPLFYFLFSASVSRSSIHPEQQQNSQPFLVSLPHCPQQRIQSTSNSFMQNPQIRLSAGVNDNETVHIPPYSCF